MSEQSGAVRKRLNPLCVKRFAGHAVRPQTRRLVVHRHKFGVQPSGLLLQQVNFSVCCQRGHGHVDVLRHRDGLPADGAGAAQYGNGSNHVFFLFILSSVPSNRPYAHR